MSAAWESESGGGRGVQNPGPRLEGQPSHTGEHASEASPAPVERAGLLSRLSTSLRTGGAAAADTGTAGSGQHSPYGDLEQPLLPGSNEEEQQLAGYSQEPKRWPQLRLSSVSNRRLSPSLLSPTASEGWGGLLQPHPPARQPPVMQQSSQRSSFSQPLLSPRGTGGGFASPFTSTVLTATSATAEEQQQQQQHYPTAPFHTPVLDYQADAGALYDVATGGVGQPGEPVPGRKQGPAVGEAPEAGRYTRAAVTGAVNAVVALPIMLSFAAIIFRDPFFHPYLGSLVKLVFLASALHQAAFAAFSTLPFAVGQVQDVGLIFLSAIASSVVGLCGQAGVGAKNTLATVLATLTCSTGVVGALIVGTGVLKLAGVVQYVPLPVVGGYLCFVGYFCLAAGVSLASGVEVSGLASWAQLASAEALLKLAPALAMVLLITVVLQRFRSPFVLPALLVAAPALFYAVLWCQGMSLEEAREAGWVSKPQPGDGEWQFWRAWQLYNIHDFPPTNILWSAMPQQLGKLLALYFVVAFGSSMDIAAIQADTPRDLDYSKELVTVGVSNLLTAFAGVGFTGSYIFSQTLFSLRMGVDTPLMGAIIATAELAVFMLPVNVMTYLPSFYFGGLTAWIGQDILKDWLFISYKRVSGVEYCLLLSTFALVLAFGLEAGIAAGILLAALNFAYSYSKVTISAFNVVPSRSGTVRTFDQRTVLDMFGGRITAVSLSGYLFFGSSVNVVERVIAIAKCTLDSQPHLDPQQQHDAGGADAAGSSGEEQQAGRRMSTALPSSATLCRTYDNVAQFLEGQPGTGGEQAANVAAALAESPRFLILDFRRVQGLDATAARSFVTLHNKLQRMGIQLIITHIPARRGNVRRLLAAQGLILRQPSPVREGQEEAGGGGAVCAWFPTMDAGCQHCEEQFLGVAVAHALCPPPATCMSLEQALQAHLELPRCILGDAAVDYAAAAAALACFTTKHAMRAGASVFQLGSPADDIFIIECGSVTCRIDFNLRSVSSRRLQPALPPSAKPSAAERTFTYGPGSIVGELDFFLQRPRSFTAVADADGSAWRITRRAFERMAASDPASLVLLETIILRSTCLSAAHALEALERSSAAD